MEKLDESSGDHDQSGHRPTQSGCRPSHGRRPGATVDPWGVVGGVEPVDSDMNDPYAVEVNQPLSERPSLIVRLGEHPAPLDPVELHVPLRRGEVYKTSLLGDQVSMCPVRL